MSKDLRFLYTLLILILAVVACEKFPHQHECGDASLAKIATVLNENETVQ